MSEQREPKVGDMVHYMAGDADLAAVITTLSYYRAMPPNSVTIDPLIYQPKQALLILASMQQPYWTEGYYSEACESGTWHWPELHDPPPPTIIPPPPPMFIGFIVHFARQPFLHQPAIVCNVMSGGLFLDLAVLNSDKGRVDFAYNVPEDRDYTFTTDTWHRIRGDEYVTPHEEMSSADVSFNYVPGVGGAL